MSHYNYLYLIIAHLFYCLRVPPNTH